MSAIKLPTKLRKEPLVDVVCAVNFKATAPAESLLPGLIMQKLAGYQLKFEALGAAQLPQVLRDQDPNLQNAPLMSIRVDDQFAIIIGTRWLGVGCIMPYTGWKKFKTMICTVFDVLRDASFITEVSRHSLKYVDFIESNDGNSLARFNVDLKVAGHVLSSQTTQIRTELAAPPFIHAVSIISAATAHKPDSVVRGAVVEVDTHRVETFVVSAFLENIGTLLDQMHASNKELFFNLLSDAGLKELEPIYA